MTLAAAKARIPWSILKSKELGVYMPLAHGLYQILFSTKTNLIFKALMEDRKKAMWNLLTRPGG